MPVAEWTCYAAALPALDAHHTLRHAEATALPWLSPQDRRRSLSQLHRTIDPAPPDTSTPVPGHAIRHATPGPTKKPPPNPSSQDA